MEEAFMHSANCKTVPSRGDAPVNGLKTYYESEGTGPPLFFPVQIIRSWPVHKDTLRRSVRRHPFLVR